MNKNADISERISEIIETVKLTPNNFAKKLKYDRSQTIYDIINGKSAPSFDFFQRFLNSEFSETINLYWLITGDGDKIRTNEVIDTEVRVVKEPRGNYITECKMCIEKDNRISELINQNKKLIDIIDKLTNTTDDALKKNHKKTA